MESVGHESDVRMDKSHHVGHVDLELVPWVKQDLNPSIGKKNIRNHTPALISSQNPSILANLYLML